MAGKDTRVTVRFSDAEHIALLKEANRRGVKVSTCLRDLAVSQLNAGPVMSSGFARQGKVQAVKPQVGRLDAVSPEPGVGKITQPLIPSSMAEDFQQRREQQASRTAALRAQLGGQVRVASELVDDDA